MNFPSIVGCTVNPASLLPSQLIYINCYVWPLIDCTAFHGGLLSFQPSYVHRLQLTYPPGSTNGRGVWRVRPSAWPMGSRARRPLPIPVSPPAPPLEAPSSSLLVITPFFEAALLLETDSSHDAQWHGRFLVDPVHFLRMHLSYPGFKPHVSWAQHVQF